MIAALPSSWCYGQCVRLMYVWDQCRLRLVLQYQNVGPDDPDMPVSPLFFLFNRKCVYFNWYNEVDIPKESWDKWSDGLPRSAVSSAVFTGRSSSLHLTFGNDSRIAKQLMLWAMCSTHVCLGSVSPKARTAVPKCRSWWPWYACFAAFFSLQQEVRIL